MADLTFRNMELAGAPEYLRRRWSSRELQRTG
jgi:hypothetical protein